MPALHDLFQPPLAVLVFVFGLMSGCDRRPLPVDTFSDERNESPVAVQTVTVTTEDIDRTTRQPASVHAYHRAAMRAKSSGYLTEVLVDIGDSVQAGDRLAVVAVPELADQREVLKARIARCEAQEQSADAATELAAANVDSAEAKLEQAKSEQARGQALLAAIEAEFDRTRDLVERQSLERRVLDEVRKKRDSEVANQQAIASSLTSAEAEIAVARSARKAAAADLEVARAETSIARRQLDRLDTLIDYATLKAPFDGVVTQRNAEPGDLVQASADPHSGEPLFVISRIDKVRIQIPVPEADAAGVHRGDRVQLRFPSYPDEPAIEAEVSRTSASLDPQTRTMLVEVEVPNPQGKLIPGMFGEATIQLSTAVAAKVLPARAIRFDESGQAHVYLVDDTKTVSVVPITVGADDGRLIEVRSGVETGQRVIDASLRRFADGDRVRLL